MIAIRPITAATAVIDTTVKKERTSFFSIISFLFIFIIPLFVKVEKNYYYCIIIAFYYDIINLYFQFARPISTFFPIFCSVQHPSLDYVNPKNRHHSLCIYKKRTLKHPFTVLFSHCLFDHFRLMRTIPLPGLTVTLSPVPLQPEFLFPPFPRRSA